MMIMIGGLQTIFSMNYVVLVRELPIYLGRWLDYQKTNGISKEDDKSYLHSSSSNVQQHNNSKQSTLSDFMICYRNKAWKAWQDWLRTEIILFQSDVNQQDGGLHPL